MNLSSYYFSFPFSNGLFFHEVMNQLICMFSGIKVIEGFSSISKPSWKRTVERIIVGKHWYFALCFMWKLYRSCVKEYFRSADEAFNFDVPLCVIHLICTNQK